MAAADTARAKAALDKYDTDNPLVGRMGIMLGFGAAPPGFEEQVQAKQKERQRLALAVRRAEEAHTRLRQKTEQQLAAIGRSHADPAVRRSAEEELNRIRSEKPAPAGG